MKDLSGVLSALANLLWPIITIVVIFILMPEIRQILMRLRSAQSFNLKWGDKEITVQEGFDNLEKVVRDIFTEMQKEIPASEKAAPSLSLGQPDNQITPSERTKSPRGGKRILWVDDKPQNNVFENQQLKSIGWEIDEALSTIGALSAYSAARHALVITDM